jgi:hypothetical protein
MDDGVLVMKDTIKKRDGRKRHDIGIASIVLDFVDSIEWCGKW